LIKNVIFDFDGTLVDSSIAVDKMYAYFADKYKLDNISREQFKNMKRLPLKEKLKMVHLPLYKLPSLTIQARKLYSSHLEDVKLIEGIEKILTILKEREIQMSILSSNSIANIKMFLENNKINFFEDIYSSKNILKKDRAILKLLKRKKLNKNEILYVGDELQDIISCKKIDVKVAAVSWGYDDIELLRSGEPDCICQNPLEIYGCVF
jgi:phosphoglycolate phosphatase